MRHASRDGAANQRCAVLTAGDPVQRQNRLSMCMLLGRILKSILRMNEKTRVFLPICAFSCILRNAF